jgi:ribosomal protein L40E
MAFDDPIVIILFGLLLVLLLSAIAYFLTRVVKVAWGKDPRAQASSAQVSSAQVTGDSKFCIKCGAKIPQKADFCAACGNKQS